MNIVKVAIAASGASTQREFGQKLGKGQTAVAKYVKPIVPEPAEAEA